MQIFAVSVSQLELVEKKEVKNKKQKTVWNKSNNQNIFIDGRLSMEAKKELLSDIREKSWIMIMLKQNFAIDLQSFWVPLF